MTMGGRQDLAGFSVMGQLGGSIFQTLRRRGMCHRLVKEVVQSVWTSGRAQLFVDQK
jgi:hypothetical protein